jgi:hypothetical protein
MIELPKSRILKHFYAPFIATPFTSFSISLSFTTLLNADRTAFILAAD